MIGGCIGSALRLGISVVLPPRKVTCGRLPLLDFPVATLLVNLSGTFANCALYRLAVGSYRSGNATAAWAGFVPLFSVGFCGGYTTFSTFAVDCAKLLTARRWATLAAYLAVNIGGGLALGYAGWCLGELDQ